MDIAVEVLPDAPTEEQITSQKKLQEIKTWAIKIKPLLRLLAYTPETDLEIRMCSEEQFKEEDPLFKDPELAIKCQDLYDKLVERMKEAKAETEDLWKMLQDKWNDLKDHEDFQLQFTFADSGVIKALQDLKKQFILREEVKQERIGQRILELREEISDIWDKCMITKEEKDNFKEYYAEPAEFSEELLNIHKEELKQWQIYHEKNQEILVKIKTRDKMWKDLRDLESRADDPNRFKNRGGALLKDQNLHNSILKKLPKLEAELVSLAKQFETEHGRKIKIFGKEIPAIIDDEWKCFKMEKTNKKNRVLINSDTPTGSIASGIPLKPIQSRDQGAEKRSKLIGAPSSISKRFRWDSSRSLDGI